MKRRIYEVIETAKDKDWVSAIYDSMKRRMRIRNEIS